MCFVVSSNESKVSKSWGVLVAWANELGRSSAVHKSCTQYQLTVVKSTAQAGGIGVDVIVDGRSRDTSCELWRSAIRICEPPHTALSWWGYNRMRLHTSVMSLAPIKPHRGALPDMLSGGGRQILASYTEFSYQGNFSDAACRLIDTLPHQSPALGVSLRPPPSVWGHRLLHRAAAVDATHYRGF